jgi:hypothetical protein
MLIDALIAIVHVIETVILAGVAVAFVLTALLTFALWSSWRKP